MTEFIYAQLAAQLDAHLLRSEQQILEIKRQAEESRRKAEEQTREFERLRREYEEKQGLIVDLGPDDVSVIEETKLIGGS